MTMESNRKKPALPLRIAALMVLLATLATVGQAIAEPSAAVTDKVNWKDFLARQDMVWDSIPTTWDEGHPGVQGRRDRLPTTWGAGAMIGNGLLGAMIYSDKDCPMRWEIARCDVTDHRKNHATGELGHNGGVDVGRLPNGYFVLEPVGKPTGGTMRLHLWDAEATGTLTTDKGKITWRSFVHASDLAIVIEFQTEGEERQCQWKWVAEESSARAASTAASNYKPNPPAKIEKVGATNVSIQPLLDGGQYATAWQETALAPDHRWLAASVGNSFPGDSATKDAVDAVQKAVATGLDPLVASHRKWWHDYYPASFVSIPDARLESFYWIQIYKFASATRADRPALDQMGPWYFPTGWPYMCHNMNTEMNYYPVLAANRLELGESLCRMLDRNAENLARNAGKWKSDSAALGRVSDNSLWCPVVPGPNNAGEIGCLPWICHDYWLQYRYSMDDAMLRERLFPLLRRSINYYLHLVEKSDDGRLRLPPSYSPEFGSYTDCNFDLALFRWGCQTLLRSCERLKLDDPLIPKWKEVLEKSVDYPQGPDGLSLGRDKPLLVSHRHWSHLLMIWPLYTLNWDQPENRDLIKKSVEHYAYLKGEKMGFSLLGVSSMMASIGNGGESMNFLNQLLDRPHIFPNTMDLEGGPVIESCLGVATCLHDMLIQSWGDKIRVFPAVPDAWKDVTIHKLRAEGAFLVSAVRRDGKPQWVRIESLAGEPCRVKTGLAEPVKIKADRAVAMKQLPEGVLELDLKKGESALLYSGDTVPPLDVEPVAAQTGVPNCWGSSKKVALPAGKQR